MKRPARIDPVSDDEDEAEASDEASDETEERRASSTPLLRSVVVTCVMLLMLTGGMATIVTTGVLTPLIREIVFGDDYLPLYEIPQKATTNIAAESPSKPVFFEIPEIMVALMDDNLKPTYLKVKLVLDLRSEKDLASLERGLPRVVDNLNCYLRELHLEDINSAPGIHRMHWEIAHRISETIPPAAVRDVFFREIAIQ